MKIIKISVCLISLLFAQCGPALAGGAIIVDSKTGKYLGNYNKDALDSNSVSNPIGRYGSAISPESINNQIGEYGSPLSPSSPNYPYGQYQQPRYDSNDYYSHD